MQTRLQSFTIGKKAISIFVPDSFAIQKEYKHQHTPYWGQVWHAAIGLCIFLQEHPEYIKNVSCKVIDWDIIENITIPEVVLLRDINYEPDAFAPLLIMINHLLENSCTIILSTPQRLMAKNFIEQVLVKCINQATIPVLLREKQEDISVFVLVKK